MSNGAGSNIPAGLFSSESERDRLINSVSKTQDETKRREIREGYRKLQDELIADKQNLIDPGDEENLLQKKLKAINNLFTNVKQPREGTLDSSSLVKIADLGMKKAQALQTDFVQFYATDFCEKVKVVIASDADLTNSNSFTHEDWIRLGSTVGSLFQKTPVLRFMCGSFDRGEVSVTKRAKLAKGEKVFDKSTEKATQPTQLSKFETVEGGELTTKYVEHVLKTLWHVYEQEENEPVDFFEFVTHPTEFGQTVENIFYTSFLIRDGHAKVSLDVEGLPVIEPVKREEGGTSDDSMDRQQLVLDITPAQWRHIVTTFMIEEPLIQSMSVSADAMKASSSQS